MKIFEALNHFLLSIGYSLQNIRENESGGGECPIFLSHKEFIKFYSGKYELQSIYDIGSHKGWWTREIQEVLPRASFTLIDPVTHDLDFRQEAKIQQISALLSSDAKLISFFSSGESGDSYYKEIGKNYGPNQVKTIVSTTLDEVVSKHKLKLPDLIKLDTQGSELDILDGASFSLNSCKIIICEIPISDYNTGAPKFVDYLNKLSELGYEPTSILEGHRYLERLIQLDLAFIKT